jgi:NDP-sugar pyrophosphorylase family protein
MNDKMQVVILAGGLATRLGNATKDIPKSMIDIDGYPFIFYQLGLLSIWFDEVVICIGHLGQQIKNYVGDGSTFGINIKYSDEGENLLGTGGAVKNALQLLRDNFCLTYGDSYLSLNYDDVQKSFIQRKKLGLITVYNNNSKLYQNNILGKNGYVINYNKQNPTYEMKYIDYGLSVLNKQSFNFMDNQYHDLSEVFINLIDKKELIYMEIENKFKEVGSELGIKEFKKSLGII